MKNIVEFIHIISNHMVKHSGVYTAIQGITVHPDLYMSIISEMSGSFGASYGISHRKSNELVLFTQYCEIIIRKGNE